MSALANKNVQRIQALANANAIRIERAELKRDIKAGHLDPAQVVRECENGLPLFELLCAIPRVGRVKARNWLTTLRMNHENVTLGGERRGDLRPITMRERELVAALIERS